ncbi:AbrB/MazE/SpoVT family DNA-binding domain-containing protein [Mycolicibacter senuensis]|uniref:AbrB/MazE/SpoVT family DNA-binding domain-containing protein n=1 Tax=Mycolicibacter senuensis TaxID=386913 RepID=UPI000DCE7EF3|nr:AbrB/MazE/SpoVT family DNA-binding domain-containing protein [Mycolicibacter senuensis]RAU90271.1 hypothetical protein DQP56_23385 [Mycolicibacter senuensis]
MAVVIDSVGRIVVPKPLRDALGSAPGTVVDVSRYGDGVRSGALHLRGAGRHRRTTRPGQRGGAYPPGPAGGQDGGG